MWAWLPLSRMSGIFPHECDGSSLASSAVSGRGESGDAIVDRVRTDPIPQDAVRVILAERPIMESDAGRADGADLLEANGRVPRIGLEEFKVLVGKLTDGLGQLPVVKPELRRSEVSQSGVQRPAS